MSRCSWDRGYPRQGATGLPQVPHVPRVDGTGACLQQHIRGRIQPLQITYTEPADIEVEHCSRSAPSTPLHPTSPWHRTRPGRFRRWTGEPDDREREHLTIDEFLRGHATARKSLWPAANGIDDGKFFDLAVYKHSLTPEYPSREQQRPGTFHCDVTTGQTTPNGYASGSTYDKNANGVPSYLTKPQKEQMLEYDIFANKVTVNGIKSEATGANKTKGEVVPVYTQSPDVAWQPRLDAALCTRDVVYLTVSRHTDTELDDAATQVRPRLSPFLRSLPHFYPLHGDALSLWYLHLTTHSQPLHEDFSQTILLLLQRLYRQVAETSSTRARSARTEYCTDKETQTDLPMLQTTTSSDYITLIVSTIQNRIGRSEEPGIDPLPTTSSALTQPLASDNQPSIANTAGQPTLGHTAAETTRSRDETEAEPSGGSAEAEAERDTSELSAAEAEDAERSLCGACLSRERDRVLLPCAHLVLCSACVGRVTRCPVCRQQILATVRVQL